MGFVVFEDAVRAVRAVAGWTKLGIAKRNEAAGSVHSEVQPIVAAEAVNEFEAKRALARVGIRIPCQRLAANRDAAIAAAREIGFPVVLKICSADLPHKTEIGGVALRLSDPDAVAAAYDRIIANAAERAPTARIDGVIVAEQLQAGVEMSLGARQDQLFGTMIMLGFGGILVEVVKDVALRRAPLSETDVNDMIGELRANALLQGVRGQEPSDIAALRAAVVRFAELARVSSIQSIEINPLLVLPTRCGVAALDCLIEGGGEQRGKGVVA
jgi:succinyl-CoA synthetase beta subunit